MSLDETQKKNASATRTAAENVSRNARKVSENLYEIHFNRPAPKRKVDTASQSSRVLKAGELKKSEVRTYVPGVLGSLEKGQAEIRPESRAATLENLKSNLQSLNQLHLRLRFMLKELEEFTE